MATYKVIQEVEAEDKIIGPFALKHIVYGMAAAGIAAAGWFVGDRVSYWLAVPLLAPFFLAAAFVALSALLRLNQPGDVWLFSKMNFMFRPRKRLWRQAGGYKPFIITGRAAEEKEEEAAAPAGEVGATARNLSSILDTRGRSTATADGSAAAARADNLDEEHDGRHSDLNRRYHRLLGEHRDRRKKGVDYRLKQTLRARSRNLPPAPAAAGGQSFKTPPSDHLSAKISEMAEFGDLKISTLEKMVRNIKSKERLKRGRKRS